MSPKPYKGHEDQQGDKGSITPERSPAMRWNSLALLEQSRVVNQSTGRLGVGGIWREAGREERLSWTIGEDLTVLRAQYVP